MTDEALASPGEQAAPDSAPAEAPTFEPTPREAINRAFEALEKEDPAPAPAEEAAPEAEAPQQDDPPRDEHGRFKAKEGEPEAVETPEAPQEPAEQPEAQKPSTFAEAPDRFSPDAKAAWKDVPEAARAEMHRAITEMEGGIQKYRQDAEAFSELRELDQFTRSQGKDIKSVLTNYIQMENFLREKPMEGLAWMMKNMGMTPQQYAAQVTGQPQEAAQAQQDQTIVQLQNEIAGLRQQISGVSTTVQSQTANSIEKQIADFAADPKHSRFDELSDTIGQMLETGFATDLADAYDKAERLNPAPVVAQPAPEPKPAPQPDPAVQTQKGQKSISGAPGNGSNPVNRQPPSSPREALDRAFANVGI